MKGSPRLILPMLALVLMGNSCEFWASTNTLPPRTETGETPESGEGGGLVVVVRSGDEISALDSESAGGTDAIVAAAVATSASSYEALLPEAAELPSEPSAIPESSPPRMAAMTVARAAAAPVVANAVPEPSGLLLFLGGLVVAGAKLGRR